MSEVFDSEKLFPEVKIIYSIIIGGTIPENNLDIFYFFLSGQFGSISIQ